MRRPNLDTRAHNSHERNIANRTRGGSSLCSAFFGALCIILSSGLIFWNEGHAVDQHESLAEGRSVVVEFDPNNGADDVDEAKKRYENRLVHISGRIDSHIPHVRPVVTDDAFGIAVAGTSLHRIVEMWQWKGRIRLYRAQHRSKKKMQ